MIRYQIRNEYGLSDPELYAAPGEEDDPEALLEGVAMAGLVGVLRQLGDLAEFAAEIFHDLHEDVMATASRGHGLMLRLQQLEAEFPAVEKAIISQTDPSNYPHDDGVEWHANLQLKQNMITQGDMPRFILDSYEECRGPPHLFTLDKFDVAGAGASLKRYSDPSFFKTEHSSNMVETDDIIEKRPRRIKKKAMRWRKGVTLEALLIANSESHTTSKDRASRKVPPRTTKLKSRHPRDPDHRTISMICREHLQELIASQQKILSNYSPRHYRVKFRSTDSSETSSPFGELDNSRALPQCHGKVELTKVVPVNESDTPETASAPTNGSTHLEVDDKQFLGTWHRPTEAQEVCNMPLMEQNGMIPESEKLPDCPNSLAWESSHILQSVHEGKLQLATVPAEPEGNYCRPDDIEGDQDNFVDALNNMESEGEADLEKKTKWVANANADMGGDELNSDIREGENAVHAQIPELGSALGSPRGLSGSCSDGEPTSLESHMISECALSTVSNTNGPISGSPSDRQLNSVDWTNEEEPCNDDDLMDVSSSSSAHSVNADFETNDHLVGCQQYQERAHCPSNDDRAAIIVGFGNQLTQKPSGMDDSATSSSDCTDKAYNSVEHGQKFLLDDTYMVLSKRNDVSQDEEETNVVNTDGSFFHPTIPNQEQTQELKNLPEEGTSRDTDTSPVKPALLPDKDHVMHELDMGNVAVSEETVEDTSLTDLDPVDIHDHLDGAAPTISSMHDNILYESDHDETVEDLQILPDDDLSTTSDKHVGENQEIAVFEEGACPASLNTNSEDSTQATVVPQDLSSAQELSGISRSLSPPQDDTEAHVEETLAPPSPCMLNNDTKAQKIGVPLVPNTSSLLETNSSSVEQHIFTETQCTVNNDEVVLAARSVTNRFTENMIRSEVEPIDGAKHTEKGEVLPTDSLEEDSSHDIHIQSGSSCREVLETASCRNFGTPDELSDLVSNKSILQTDSPHFTQAENEGENCSDTDDIQYLSTARFPEEYKYQEELPEEASLTTEVVSRCHDAVSLESKTVEQQPADVNEDMGRVTTSQFFCGTNPFLDPACIMNHAEMDPSPSMCFQPCFSEEEDFLSELLTQDSSMGATKDLFTPADSLWEPATPPDEAPLTSEVMTEEDFRSFCHEYRQMDFTAGTEGFYNESASDADSISNGLMVSEPDYPCSVSALPVKLDQEACVHSKFGSQLAGSSPVRNMQAETSIPCPAIEDIDGDTPDADSRLKSHESPSDSRSAELDINLQLGQQELPGIDVYSSSHLLDGETMDQARDSYSNNIVAVEEKQEICANLVPHYFIDEKISELDVPTTNVIAVEPEVETCGLDEYNYQYVPSSTSEKIDVLTSKPDLVQGSEVHGPDGLDPQAMPFPSVDLKTDILEATPLSSFQTEQDSECLISAEHDSQIPLPSSVDENIDGLDAPHLSDYVTLEQEPEVSVTGGLDTQIPPCSSADKNLSSPVLHDLESEDHISGDPDFQDIPGSLVNYNIDEPESTQLNSVRPEEPEQEIHASRKLDSQVAPCSPNVDRVHVIDAGPPYSGWVESEKGSDSSTETDSQIAPCSSNSGVLDEPTVLPSTPLTTSTEKTYQVSLDPPPTETFPNISYEDIGKPPPLPPLQWRLGRPRLGVLSTQGPVVCGPASGTDTILQASSHGLGTRLGPLEQMDEPVSSQGIKGGIFQNSMLANNDPEVEFARSELDQPFSEASENTKEQGHISSGVGEHLGDTAVIHDVSENSEHHSHTHPVASVDDKSMDDHNATCGMDLHTVSPSATGQVSENGRHQQGKHDCTTDASEEKNVEHQSVTSGEPSETTNHSMPGKILEEENSQEGQNLQGKEAENPKDDQMVEPMPVAESTSQNYLQDDQMVGPLPVVESTSQNYLQDEHSLGRERIHQPSPFAVWPVDKSNYSSGLEEDDYVHVEQPPVMGWTVRPQMLHPNYGLLFEESQFEPNITDNHLIKKPISIRNIPRNPLVDAVAAHDRSSMRKVSELAPATDMPKPNERNLLLEQIRNKTFNLKPVGPAKSIAIRSPARGDTRNLKVAAIIEKANAIRQAVGSDDEDGDNWSDT
ncbi:hypothetical protein ACP4OV_008433 [Aristida adscensionis]